MRIGLIGGTFDPPHMGHMVVAEAAFRQLGLDEVRLVTAGEPWQKTGTSVTASQHRWAMTVATTSGVSYLHADDREIRRIGPTYTIDTLLGLEDRSPTLILGADAASRIRSWRRAEEVLEIARIVVAPRPGVSPASVEEAVGRPIEWLDMPPLAISATELRRRAAAGQSLRFLVREPVRDYILRHGLYAEPKH